MIPSVKDLTLEEKLTLLVGESHWNIATLGGKLPTYTMNDGPHGCRARDPKTGITPPAHAYPTLSSVASSWNRETARAVADAIADEFIEVDSDMVLAPGVNIKRNPLCGRNFEYFSEDPILAGTLAKEYIDACEKRGVGTSLKHFALNNQEYYRHMQSSDVDERAMFEIYLRAFEIALEAKPASVMCSYNPVNGIYASENKNLLQTILRDRFGFEGIVVSDWGAVHNRPKALKASLDLQMPFKAGAYESLKQAYDDGFITDAEIDTCVERLLKLIETAQERKTWRKSVLSDEQRMDIAVKAAGDCFVLLKNEGDVLPLRKGSSVLVTGDLAELMPTGGGGSSAVNPKMPEQSMTEELKATGWFSDVLFKGPVPNRSKAASTVINRAQAQFLNFTKYTKGSMATEADVAVIVTGNDSNTERESIDRETLRLKKIQEDFILNMAKHHEKVVVVLCAGAPVDVSAWIDSVDAVLLAGFGGEGVCRAVAQTLTGSVIPSGKLCETWPVCVEDTYCEGEFGDGFADLYGDHIMVGYRYYDDQELPVQFPFGYGLSYAKFAYSNLRVEKTGETDFTVKYDITNLSDKDAKEVSELYISDPVSSVVRPLKELKGFSKDLIPAGATKTVTLTLGHRDFAFYNVNLHDWYVENGRFDILVGPSSAELPLRASVEITLPDYTQYSVNF